MNNKKVFSKSQPPLSQLLKKSQCSYNSPFVAWFSFILEVCQAREEEVAQHLQDPAAGLRGGGQGGLQLSGLYSGDNCGIFSPHSTSK